MSRQIFVLNQKGEKEVEDAWDTQTPGLVVTRERLGSGGHGPGWIVTHEPSGFAVGLLTNDPENAMRIAAFLGRDDDKCPIDWTRDGHLVQDDPRAKKRRSEARRLAEACLTGPTPRATERVNP